MTIVLFKKSKSCRNTKVIAMLLHDFSYNKLKLNKCFIGCCNFQMSDGMKNVCHNSTQQNKKSNKQYNKQSNDRYNHTLGMA